MDTGSGLTTWTVRVGAVRSEGPRLLSDLVDRVARDCRGHLEVEDRDRLHPVVASVRGGRHRVAGLPVVASNHVDSETVFWGIPRAHTVLVMRNRTEVERFPNVKQDGIWIRAISRLGLAFLNEAGVVRGYDAA